MTQMDLFQTQTPETQSSPQAIPVNHLAGQAKGLVRKTHATSIRTSLELLHKKDQLGSFSKMFMGIFPLDSMRYSMIWRARSTPQGRLYFQAVRLSERHIEDNESGLWATPNTMDYLPHRSEESMRKMAEGHRKGRSRPINLREQVSEKAMALWPTPVVTDYKGARKPETIKKTGRNPMTNSLRDAVEHENPTGSGQLSGSLNPQWVEWLMGYPEGWTELED